MQPKEGRKELAPREIKFRYRRLDTTIRERAGSSQEGRKRAKDTPGYFFCFLFLFIPNSRCSRQKWVVSRSAKWTSRHLGGSSWKRPQGPNPGHLRDCWGCLGQFLGRLGHRTTAIVSTRGSWGRKISGISAWRSEGFFSG